MGTEDRSESGGPAESDSNATRREVPISARNRGSAPDPQDVPTRTVDDAPSSDSPRHRFPSGWDRYDEVAFVGGGGMGQVFKAWDPRLKRHVALKFLGRRLDNGAERFLAEAQAQARVEHENICKVYEVGNALGRPYIAMQFIDGKTLGKTAKQMSLPDLVYVVRKVAEAVHAAHIQGLIHRDLKPANIMIEQTERGFRPTVLDFGIARELGSTERREVSGTPAFMAPEQVSGESGDRRVDVWGLGAVLHTLLADGPPGAAQLPNTVPPDLRAITEKCLQLAATQRYPSAAAVAEDLRRFADGEPITAQPPSLRYLLGKRIRKHKALASVAAIALVAVGIFGGLVLHERSVIERRVALAQRFGTQVSRLEMQMRQAYGAPLHDVRHERKLVLDRMAAIDDEAKSLGDIARGPAAYAVGRAYLSLHDLEHAHERLDEAWRAGYREPELGYALGLVLGQQYQRALIQTRAIDDPVQRERAQAEIRRTLRDPALEHLRAARGSDLEAPAYVEGLIAYYEGNRALALVKAQEAFKAAPWLYEARALEGDAHTAEAADRVAHGDYDGARVEEAAALQAYAAAEALAPSDSALLEAECDGRRVGMNIAFSTGQVTAALIDEAVAPCDRARTADPDRPGPLLAEAQLLRTGANFLWQSRGIAPEPLLDRAVARASEAIAAQPDLASGYYQRGNAISVRGRAEAERGTDPRPTFEKAIADHERAIALDHKYGAPYADECLIYQYEYDWLADKELDPRSALERAIAVGQRGVIADPDDVHTHRVLGTAWLRRGMYEADHNIDPAPSLEQASKEYSAVLTINPKDSATVNNDAMVRDTVAQWRLDHGNAEGEADLDKAEARYREAERLTPNDSDTLNNLGHLSWMRARHLLRVGRDVQPAIDAGLAYLERARKVNPNEVNVYFNTSQLYDVAAEAALAAKVSPAPMIEAMLKAVDEYNRLNPKNDDVVALRAVAHTLAARAAAAAGRDPSAEFALAEKILQGADAGHPTTYTLGTHLDVYVNRAEWLVKEGRSASADLAAGEAAVSRQLEIDHGDAGTLILRGTLALIRARSSKDPDSRREAATRARTDLEAAVQTNRFVEHEVKPLLNEAETLAHAAPVTAGVRD